MAVKVKAKSKLSIYQRGLLVGGGIVLAAVGGVSAVSSVTKNSLSPLGVNEVKEMAGVREMTNVREMTITGVVSREPGTINDKDKYFITTGGGTKYILIGLRQSYREDNAEQVAKPDRPGVGAGDVQKGVGQTRPVGVGGKTTEVVTGPAAKQRPEARTDSDDRVAFEQYVGKRVTLTGFVVPVDSIGRGKFMQSPQPRLNKPGGNTETGRPSDKGPARTPAAVMPKASRAPVEAHLYDRFVVKSVVLAE